MKSLDERSHQWSGKYIEHGVQPRSGLQNHVLFSQLKGVLHELNDQRVISISRANMERERVRVCAKTSR
jgi:transglutaminase/protease-like cytokinesis protein 3